MIGLTLRRHGPFALAWVLALAVMSPLTIPSYSSAYTDDAARQAAMLRLDKDPTSLLLYGPLDAPGEGAQMNAWEMGAYLVVLTAVLAVLLTVRLTRASEEDGTLELVRSCGLRAAQPVRAAALMLVITGLALGGLTAALVLPLVGGHGVTASGAWAFGGVLAGTFLLVAGLTMVLAQVLPTVATVRGWAFALVGASFLVRAAGDVFDQRIIAGLSPLGLRSAVRPFGADRQWPWVLACGIGLLLMLGASRVAARRDLGGALLASPSGSDARMPVRSVLGLRARLSLRGLVIWAVSMGASAALLAAMGKTVVETAQEGKLGGGMLGEQLMADPAGGFIRYLGVLYGLLVAVCGISLVLHLVAEERRGLLEPVRATGPRRWVPLGTTLVVAAVGTVAVLGASAAATAAVADPVLNLPWDEALWWVLGQWPAVAVFVGLAALLVGLCPRRAWLVWLPLAVSGFLTLIGPTLSLDQSLVDLSLLEHAEAGRVNLAQVIMVLGGLAGAGIGLWGSTRRDQISG